jgi:hypothetical protein
MKKVLITLMVCCFSVLPFSQKIAFTYDSVDFIQKQKVVQFVFTYENMSAGKIVEYEYIEKRIDAEYGIEINTDFDTGYRIQEYCGKAGRELAELFIKKGELK